jgi:hypothetical protein
MVHFEAQLSLFVCIRKKNIHNIRIMRKQCRICRIMGRLYVYGENIRLSGEKAGE